MAINWPDVIQKTIVGTLVAALVGAFAYLWNTVSNGALIHLMGGATKEDLAAAISKIPLLQGPKGDPGPPGPVGATADLPNGAILAFDRKDGCPSGWTRDIALEGMVVVGATPPEKSDRTYYSTYSDYPTFSPGYADGTYGSSGMLEQKSKIPNITIGTKNSENSFEPYNSQLVPAPEIYAAYFGTISAAPRAFYALWYCRQIHQ